MVGYLPYFFWWKATVTLSPKPTINEDCLPGLGWPKNDPPWKKPKEKVFGLQGSIIFQLGGIAQQGLYRLFLFISFFPFRLRVSRQMDFSNEVKDKIHFLKTLAVYLLRRMDDYLLEKFIDDSRR